LAFAALGQLTTQICSTALFTNKIKGEHFSIRNTLPRDFTPSSDYFDEILQFPAGIEVYPFAGRVQIGQAPVFFALNPYQVLENWNLPAGLVIFRV
jgi:hypothetical protein